MDAQITIVDQRVTNPFIKPVRNALQDELAGRGKITEDVLGIEAISG